MEPDTDYAAPLRPMLDPMEGRRGPAGRWRPREVDADLRDELRKSVGKTASPDFVAPPPMGRVLGAPPDMAMDLPPGVLSQGQAQGLAAGALEPFGQAGRLMTGRSQDVPGDLASVGAAMAPIGPPGAAAALKPTYSALGRAVAGLKQSAMHPEQWLGFLKNQPGVKAAEMEHVGLADWLKAHKGPVSRETVQELIGARQPDIQVVRKGAGDAEIEAVEREMNVAKAEWDHLSEIALRSPTPENRAVSGTAYERFRSLSEQGDALRDARDQSGSETKFSQYTLPGGSNYGETLLTLPSTIGPKTAALNDLTRRMHEGEFNSLDETGRQQVRARHNQLMRDAGLEQHNDYRSTHWDEPNVLLHTRHNDRIVPGPNGEPLNSLHMEELQSDWHQEGRRRGYGASAGKQFEDMRSELFKKYNTDSLIPLRQTENKSPELVADLKRLDDAYQDAQVETRQTRPVPDAPFKQTWADLGLKHMLHRAATERNPNGSHKYDALSWTPGAAQNARYPGRGETEEAGMAKWYDETLVNKANALVKSAGGRVQHTAPADIEGFESQRRSVLKQMDDARMQIRGSTGEERRQRIESLLALSNKYDELGRQRSEALNQQPVHFLRITPAVRAAAEKGFPTFAIGGAAALGARQDNRQ